MFNPYRDCKRDCNNCERPKEYCFLNRRCIYCEEYFHYESMIETWHGKACRHCSGAEAASISAQLKEAAHA